MQGYLSNVNSNSPSFPLMSTIYANPQNNLILNRMYCARHDLHHVVYIALNHCFNF